MIIQIALIVASLIAPTVDKVPDGYNHITLTSNGSYSVSRAISRIPLGTFEITAYTAGFESCGKLPSDPAYGITKSGAKVVENHTIAADWTVLPKGTKVMIEGSPHTYTVEDVGGAIKGKKIDIYMESLLDAQEFGRQKLKVWVVE